MCSAREKKPTKYAKSQGAYTRTNDEFAGNGYWWLRSPDSSSAAECYVDFGGITSSGDYIYNVTCNCCGVVPVLKIKL